MKILKSSGPKLDPCRTQTETKMKRLQKTSISHTAMDPTDKARRKSKILNLEAVNSWYYYQTHCLSKHKQSACTLTEGTLLK